MFIDSHPEMVTRYRPYTQAQGKLPVADKGVHPSAEWRAVRAYYPEQDHTQRDSDAAAATGRLRIDKAFLAVRAGSTVSSGVPGSLVGGHIRIGW